MKYFNIIIAMVITFSLQACVSKKEVKVPKKVTRTVSLDLSKIIYPKKVGTFELQSKQRFDKKSQGIALRYLDTNKSKAYLDCYIYPMGQDTDASIHYYDNISALTYMQKEGVLKRLKQLSTDSVILDQNHTARRAVFDMENDSIAYYSVLYLSPFEDHYFKVRLSHPHKRAFLDSDLGAKTVRELFQNIKFNP